MASNAAGEEPVEAIATPADDTAEILRRLDAIRSTLQTAVLGDVMALLAEPGPEEETPLQRRARIVRIELTLRRQDVALEEWRSRVRAAEAETERQRRLFARLEAEFTQRNAGLERAVADAGQVAEALRAELDAALAERDAALEQKRIAIDEKIEFERRAGDKARDFGMASELAEARRQLAETLEQDLGRTRRDLAEVQQDLARTRQDQAQTRQELAQLQDEQRRALGEAERRIEELRSSRWRQLGIGLGLTKRATFEK
jgi:DNA repair exonuclease SbcCD ATPase subunit